MMHFVLGGARSGKSRYAEQLAAECGRPKLYLATAEAFDAEMDERIRIHQKTREHDGWQTAEAPLEIADIITQAEHAQCVILLDCITLWLGNLMHYKKDVNHYTSALLNACKQTKAELIVVANEVGLGIVPESPLARRFQDEAGRLNQAIAAQAEHVTWMVAGIPTHIKGATHG